MIIATIVVMLDKPHKVQPRRELRVPWSPAAPPPCWRSTGSRPEHT